MSRHQYTIKIIIIILTFSLSSCKIDTDIDDAARTIADSIENQADDHDNGSSSGSSSDYDSSNNYNGAIVLDSSQKGTDRFLMGTYHNDRYSALDIPWNFPATMRAYSHSIGKIDFEDAEGNLLWIATMTDNNDFNFSTEVYVDSNIPRAFYCTCNESYNAGWSCSCNLEGSSTEYDLDLSRMGLDNNDIYDDETYLGIIDMQNYSLKQNSSDACHPIIGGFGSNDYILPEDITLQFRNRRLNFETDEGVLEWSADLHEDETFDFTIGGYPDSYGLPHIDLSCGCQFWNYGEKHQYDIAKQNDIRCYCAASDGLNYCEIYYEEQ